MIRVVNVSKVFRIPHERQNTVYHNLLSASSGKYQYEEFYALKDVTLNVLQGETVGIIGRNGSGKSTLLKIIAGIYRPTKGEIINRDEVFPLLELGVGFQPEFSVRENVYLYGSLLGFPRNQMNKKLSDILRFAELDRFVDARFGKLSTGMQMRLGFAIAIQSVAPIILVDEVLAVGDRTFTEKCREVFRDFKRRGITMLFVSHDLEAIKDHCDRVLILHNGSIIDQGEPEKMVERYTKEIAA